MYFDTSITVQKPARSFIYMQYNEAHQNLKPLDNISSPSSSSSASSVISNTPLAHFDSQELTKEEEQSKKKKRQNVGYACDKCRERRVGCDRQKPICGQCKDKHFCQYTNHPHRLDNMSMRQRLEGLEDQVGLLTSMVTKIEDDYRSTIPRIQSQVPLPPSTSIMEISPVGQSSNKEEEGPSVYDWAIGIGWPVLEAANGMRSIFTSIKNFEDLSELLRNTIKDTINNITRPLYTDSSFPKKRPSMIILEEPEKTEHSFTLFESLNRYNSHNNNSHQHHPHHDNISEDIVLETDIKTRIIQQHHKCGFPTLVRPSRFESHYRQGQLQSLVLSSVFSHSVPHCCIYHPHLTHYRDYKDLGSKFYDYSHDLLAVDEPANLSNIHQRTLLITYDLDVGRVRRAFLHIGIAIRMCFLLDLHRPEGYVSCKTAYEREQAKRIFWSVWFYDNMVPHLFHDQLSTIKLNQIKIDPPTPLPEFDANELEQTTFATSLIKIRKIAGSISETSRMMKPKAWIARYREELFTFYSELPRHLQFQKQQQQNNTSIWERRNYFCILLDYCLCWITIYRASLPPAVTAQHQELTNEEQEAILHTSQAAVAMVQLFQSWFHMSLQSSDGFDCFFRPYLYHFMSAKHIFTANVSQFGRSPALVYVSRAYLALLLELYQATPTKYSVDESALEKSLVEFLNKYQISTKEIVYQAMIDEALMDDTNADSGWSIFSTTT